MGLEAYQPHLDNTDQKNFGGWEMLLDYLSSTRFRDDVINVNTLVLQLDSDIVEHPNFAGNYRNQQGIELTSHALITDIIHKLVIKINAGDAGFFEKHKQKIVFAICVHSLECWLYAFHYKKPLSKPKIVGCGRALNHEMKTSGFDGKKDKRLYQEHTRFFLKPENINLVTAKDQSFKTFIQQLEAIS